MKEKMRNSIGMFDFIKGVFVLYMFFIHSTFSPFQLWNTELERRWSVIFVFLYKVSFGFIPMLFLICGYEFRKKSMKKAISLQLKFIWKPYLLVAASTTVLTCLFYRVNGESVVSALKFQTLPFVLGTCPTGTYFGIYMNSIGPLWCILAFVFSGIILNVVLQEEQEWVQFFLVFCMAIAGVVLKNRTIPFCFQQSLICTFYMYIGWTMKKYRFFEKRIPPYTASAAGALMIYTAYSGPFEFSGNHWPNGLTDVLSGISGGVLLMILGLWMNRLEWKPFDYIRWLGRRIMPICCIHTVIYLVLPITFTLKSIDMTTLSAMLFSIYIITGVGGCYLIERWKYRKRRAD